MIFDSRLSRSPASPARTFSRHRDPSSFMRRAWTLAACAGAFVASAPSAALSAPAACDLDCEQGFVCELAPAACPAILCLDENDPSCPRCDGEPVPYCAPAACESDADCGGGTVCAEQTVFVDCPVSAPTPETDRSMVTKAAGSMPEAAECTPSVIKQCTPRWQLPCDADVDCGAGFRCAEQQRCSVPPAPADPDERERAAAAEVTCEPSGVFACVVIETSCDTNADCAAQFVCADDLGAACSSSNGRPACVSEGPARICMPEITAFADDSIGGVAIVVPASAESGQPRAAASDADASSSAGSCAMSTPRRSQSVPALFAVLGFVAAFARRRKRTAESA